MLIHHLFYSDSSTLLYDDISIQGHGLTQTIGIWCKVCVAIFVFLSGYGLAVSAGDINDIPTFYKKRLKKLYLNYWFIWLIFVPIGVFCFNRGFVDVYGNHMIIKAILEFFGLYNLLGGLGYNPTWWFYSCIIVLYLLYPFLKRYLLKTPVLIGCTCICIVPLTFLPFIGPIRNYLFSFVLGIALVQIPIPCIKELSQIELVLSFVLLAITRIFAEHLTCMVDGLICITLSLLLFKCTIPAWIEKIFVSLGKHSMNIFLFHTFIYYYWFKEFIYCTRNPFLIFIELLLVCYVISLLIEFGKERIGFYKLLK